MSPRLDPVHNKTESGFTILFTTAATHFAEVALGTGQATLAQRLLKRAAQDAREHAPLRDAIRHITDGT